MLLTLDKEDFIGVLGNVCYGLAILLPYDFLTRERAAGKKGVEVPRLDTDQGSVGVSVSGESRSGWISGEAREKI